MDELSTKHRKELKELEAKITQKKKAATKKTRKGINDECETLRQATADRQRAELAALGGDQELLAADDQEAEDMTANMQDLQIEEPKATETAIDEAAAVTSPQPVRKVNRARARIERRQAEQEALYNSAAKEASNLPDLKRAERDRMVTNFTSRGLVEQEIRADGHCLYSAFADQMTVRGLPLKEPTASPSKPSKLRALSNSFRSGHSISEQQQRAQLDAYKTVRASAADYIDAHPDDFSPFLEESLPTYVHKIRDTAEWGGQLELMALAKTYGVTINVLQGDGRVEAIAPENSIDAGAKVEGNKDKQLWLAYYRHGFGLGEHYNSLRPGAQEARDK